jgi:hypothetical protein
VFVSTKRGDCRIDINIPVAYRLCVRGRITASWRDRFDDMVISTTPAPDGAVMTTLEGVLADQAAVVGVINSLHDLRLAILSVECLGNLGAAHA